MKKIITLITMFVLSVSCLMAQGVFTYQAVVYNDNGDSLVVDQDVIATVTITDDASHTYTQDPQTVHTSLNGLAVLSIGDASNPQFKNMDWATAKITVDFKVGSSTVMAVAEEQIPAVPYAIKAETKITTPMVRDYVQKATIDDVERIIDAMSPQLQADLLGAIVDTAIDNFELAKEIFLYYVQHAEAEDAQRLFNAMVSNPNRVEIMDALAGYLLDTLETADGKEMMVSLLENYVTNLKASEVEKILGAIPENVRNTVADSAIRVLLKWKITEGSTTVLDSDIKDALKEITKNYLETITFEEVKAMVNAVESNNATDGAMPVLQNQFNIWMNQYVETLVKRYMISDYYYCETGLPRDVCGTTTPCLSAPATFTLPTTDYDYYTATITYGGTTPSTVAPSSLQLLYTASEGSETASLPLSLEYVSAVNADNQIIVSIPAYLVENFYDYHNPAGAYSNQVAVMIVFSDLGCTPNSVQIDIFF